MRVHDGERAEHALHHPRHGALREGLAGPEALKDLAAHGPLEHDVHAVSVLPRAVQVAHRQAAAELREDRHLATDALAHLLRRAAVRERGRGGQVLLDDLARQPLARGDRLGADYQAGAAFAQDLLGAQRDAALGHLRDGREAEIAIDCRGFAALAAGAQRGRRAVAGDGPRGRGGGAAPGILLLLPLQPGRSAGGHPR